MPHYPQPNPADVRPPVLCCSGLDPSGGAGLQADIEAVFALDAHALVALTATTIQNTHNAYRVDAVPDTLFQTAIETLAEDIAIRAIKTGLIGSAGQARWLATFAQRQALPLVTDPVLKAGGGARLADDPVAGAIVDALLPVSRLLTPNAAEARLLCGEAADADIVRCGQRLSDGPAWVLITGADEAADQEDDTVFNQLFRDGQRVARYPWPRLPHRYHGSGCTLASACAALIARGAETQAAVEQAQQYTWNSLEHAFRPGTGQHVPDRRPRTPPNA